MAIFNPTKGSKYIKPCDYTNVIKTLECTGVTGEASWTATQDCWLAVELQGGSYTSYLYLNDLVVCRSTSTTNASNHAPAVYVVRGTKIKIMGKANLTAYGCIV